jgi:hypothetical protein
MRASFGDKTAAVNPRDYVVPDYGVDQDIINVTTSIKNTEKKLNKTFTADFGQVAASVNPRDYFVPHFGVDQDIKNVKNSLEVTEKALKHKWKPTQDANGYWNTPQAADNSSYGYNQNQYINNSGLVQLESEVESDPICASSGCTQYKHPEVASWPKNYPVPDFGQDHDVKDSINNEAIA